MALWTLGFVIAGYVGRATIIDGASLSLVWPAAGVAVLFLATCHQAKVGVLVCIGAATFVVNRTTGASDALGVVFVVTNVSQAVLFVGLSRRWMPHVWGFGGSDTFHRLADLGRLTIVALVSGLAGASLGSLGLQLVTGATSWPAFVTWWGRTAVGAAVIVALGLLLGPGLSRVRTVVDLRAALWRAVAPRHERAAKEAAGLVVFTAVLYWVIFFRVGGQPLSFLLLIPAVWAGVRFSPPAVAVHGIVTGASAVVLTLTSHGMFVGIERTDLRAVVVQVFVAMAMLTGLALAFSRAERERAMDALGLARQAEAERAALLSAVLESMSEGVMVVDEGDEPVVQNLAGERMFRGPLRWVRADGAGVQADDLPHVRALRGDRIVGEDYVLQRDDSGIGQIVEVVARPMPRTVYNHPRAMVMARDVTLDRDHRASLTRFAGVVAHDLQNPLTIATTWSEVLRTELADGPLEPDVALPMLARIESATAHMSTFIGDLLAYTVTRDQPLHLDDVALAQLARHVARLHEERPSRPVFIVEEMPSAWADRRLLRQLLDNLLGNAVKYVAPGVQPRVVVTASEVRAGWVEVRVADNGIGIPDADRERVFEALERSQVSKDYRGTGLGLAICRHVVDRHGGSIRADAGPDGGTTVVFTLPCTTEAYVEAVSRTPSGGHPRSHPS